MGWGDQKSRNDIHGELKTLQDGLGKYESATAIGTYIAGMLGKWDDSIVRVQFERGMRVYKLQWDGEQLIATNTRAPLLAADTLVEPVSDTALIEWNIVTLKGFALTFDPSYRTLTVHSDAGSAQAVRRP